MYSRCATVEQGVPKDCTKRCATPYTRALLTSMPSMDPANRTLVSPLSGDPPSPIDPPSGCRFHTRCPHAEAVCSQTSPQLTLTGDNHFAACLMVQAGAVHSQSPVAELIYAGALA
ncbi:MAG: oligopeptide/dipeptide ABC transporter ATP-binding protein [Pseudomonas sp.]